MPGELKPCPICGCKSISVFDVWPVRIECNRCRSYLMFGIGPASDSELVQRAIDNWNKRAINGTE